MRKVQVGICLTLFVIFGLAGLCSGQAVTLSVKVGSPTTKTLVSGSGFEANSAIDIYFDTTDDPFGQGTRHGRVRSDGHCRSFPEMPKRLANTSQCRGCGTRFPTRIATA
jgi:hypothetical protein